MSGRTTSSVKYFMNLSNYFVKVPVASLGSIDYKSAEK